jgi:hypothetical protein
MLPNDVVSNVPDITSTDVTKQDPSGLEQGSANFPMEAALSAMEAASQGVFPVPFADCAPTGIGG